MRVAIVHYWLVAMRGGEKVIEEIGEIFPDADIYTHVYKERSVSDKIKSHKIMTTFINDLPFATSRYQSYLPLMPLALEQLDLTDYDLVISSESGPAKGVITRPDALHVCYCHSPMRYVWSGYHEYMEYAGPATRCLMPYVMHRLRLWDLASAARVDQFFANSENVASRIRKYYRREATVVYPPVDVDCFSRGRHDADFYLFVSQLVKYKRANIAVEAFNRLGRPLVVIGQGAELNALRKLAAPNVKVIGYQDDETLREYYGRCRALVFVADEDFGIVPLEAMSTGAPVIAFRHGGTLETVVPGETGIFFDEQTPESLIAAVKRFEEFEGRFDSALIMRHVQRFSRGNFRRSFSNAIDACLAERRKPRARPRREFAEAL
jgi:glycosyltransferase involved in cell wall biosynthesis